MHAFVNHFLAFEAILVDKSVHEQTFAVLFAGIERDAVSYTHLGFAGSQDGKLEMLFVAPEVRGRGVGRALLAHAVEHAGVRTLDVNEQNPQAVGFYEHEGFVVAGRSPVDDAGRPFPLLHMRRACDDEEGERS